MVLFVWTDEVANPESKSCKNWYIQAVVEASNEKEAWEILYQNNDCLWWSLQGATNYRETPKTANLAQELYLELKKSGLYKTLEAQEPKLSGNCATKKSNY